MTNVNIDASADNPKKHKIRGLDIKAEESSRISVSLVDVDSAIIKYMEVPLSYTNTAYMFWANINKEHAKGLPPLQEGVSPVMKWECNYCNYLDHCKSIK